MNTDRDAKLIDFLWLLLPLALLAAFSKGADPAGLAVGFALYFAPDVLCRGRSRLPMRTRGGQWIRAFT